MNRFVKYFFAFAALAVALCGCAGEAPSSPASSAPGEDPSQQSSLPQEEAQATPEMVEVLDGMIQEGSLSADWAGWYDGGEPPRRYEAYDYEIQKTEWEGDTCWVTLELYGRGILDPDTGEDATEEVMGTKTTRLVHVETGDPENPYIPIGTARVELRRTGDGLLPLSCEFEGIGQPAAAYLKARTQELEAELSASPKIDPGQYDPLAVDYVYREVLLHRYVESPAGITLWDMEHFITDVDLSKSSVFDLLVDGFPEEWPRLDPGIFRLATGMEHFFTNFILSDYSFFEDLERLESISLNCDDNPGAGVPDFSALETGSARELAISGFPEDFALDLTGSQVENLALQSYAAGVTGFAGCETVETLEIHDTRTDMTLINAGNFPSLQRLTFSIYSEMPRFRDFSQLATFGEDVQIEMTLYYQACNDDTLATLEGVRLDSLTLDPYGSGGLWAPNPLGDPDPEILAQIDAEELTVAPAP